MIYDLIATLLKYGIEKDVLSSFYNESNKIYPGTAKTNSGSNMTYSFPASKDSLEELDQPYDTRLRYIPYIKDGLILCALLFFISCSIS